MLAGAHLAGAYGLKGGSAAMTPPAKVSTASCNHCLNQHAIVPEKPQKAACGHYLPGNKVIN